MSSDLHSVLRYFAFFDNNGYYSVLIPMIDSKFNLTQTKFAMLAVTRPIAWEFWNQVADFFPRKTLKISSSELVAYWVMVVGKL